MASVACNFIPARAETRCDSESVVTFGEKSYCKKHSRTVQALSAKRDYESFLEAEKAKQEDPLVEKEPEVVAEKEPEPVADFPHVSIAEPEEKPLVIKPLDEEIRVNAEAEQKPSSRGRVSLFQQRLEEATAMAAKKRVEEKPTIKSRPVATPVPKKAEPIKKKIGPNKWGRFEDPDTGIVFDPKTKAAYCVQDRKTGKIYPLRDEHIKICKRNGWNIVMKKNTVVESSPEASSSEEEEEEIDSDEEEEEEEDEEEESDSDEEEEEEETDDEEEESDDEEEESDSDEEEEEEEEDRKSVV